jgi:hypothetical protein
MSVKGQLNACGESLMIGIRRVQRSAAPDEQTLTTLRACLDVVERLERSAGEIVADQVDMALAVVTKASQELGQGATIAPAVTGAVRNAADRLQRLRSELQPGLTN